MCNVCKCNSRGFIRNGIETKTVQSNSETGRQSFHSVCVFHRTLKEIPSILPTKLFIILHSIYSFSLRPHLLRGVFFGLMRWMYSCWRNVWNARNAPNVFACMKPANTCIRMPIRRPATVPPSGSYLRFLFHPHLLASVLIH